MKRYRQWLDWWIVTLSFVVFLGIEVGILYCWFWLLQRL